MIVPGSDSMCHMARIYDLWTGDAIQLSVTVQSAVQQLQEIPHCIKVMQEQAIDSQKVWFCPSIGSWTALSARLDLCNH